MNSCTSIREAFVWASSFLYSHGNESPEFEAEVLLRSLLNMNRTEFYMQWNRPFSADIQVRFEEWIQRRIQGEPIQYILGNQEFYGRSFRVTPSVLIPRPETELLVEGILEEGKRLFPNERVSVAEVGTGSGCIAISIALEAPNWLITSVDLSSDALEVANINASSYGVLERVRLLQGNLLLPFTDKDQYEIFVSNPPYIASQEVDELEVQVREYEPRLALDGGEDGLEPYRQICRELGSWERLQLIAFEIGADQGKAVYDLVTQIPGVVRAEVRQDYARRDRMVFAWRNSMGN